MTSELGHLVGQGKSLAFPAQAIEWRMSEAGPIEVFVDGEDFWTLRFSAPDRQPPGTGVYDDARGSPETLHPTLEITGAGHSCSSTSTGTFNVLDIDYGPYGYLQAFHARFEHRCDASPDSPVLRGEVALTAPAAPQPLRLDLEFEPEQTSYNSVDQTISVLGTVTCSESAGAGVVADATELTDAPAAVGRGYVDVTCSPQPTSWLAKVITTNGIPFTADAFRITVQAQAEDKWYSEHTNERVLASEIISDVEATLASSDSTGDSFISRQATWSLVILIAVVAAIPWSLLAMRAIRRRAPD